MSDPDVSTVPVEQLDELDLGRLPVHPLARYAKELPPMQRYAVLLKLQRAKEDKQIAKRLHLPRVIIRPLLRSGIEYCIRRRQGDEEIRQWHVRKFSIACDRLLAVLGRRSSKVKLRPA